MQLNLKCVWFLTLSSVINGNSVNMAVCQSYHSPRNIYIQHLIHYTKSLSFLRIWNVKKEDHHKPTDNQLLIYAYIFTYINVIKLGSEPLKGIYFEVFINEPFFVLFLSLVLFHLIVTFYKKKIKNSGSVSYSL